MVEIAPGIKVSQWTQLKLDDKQNPDWHVAVEIFQRRIEARYLEPVDLLIEAERSKPSNQRRFGFTILAIDCLLVETLQAFRDGKKDTRRESKAMFRKFLSKRPEFCNCFDESAAERFFEDFRCGILHQAELRGGSKVWSVGALAEIRNDRIITVNRTAFHTALKREFHRYLAELKDPMNQTLRENFRQKMDYICTL